ncbi:MAG: hypothetical protein AAGE37_06855 [Pseudomonadota bacterium]
MSTFSLLFQRAAVLLIRPAVILAEGRFLPGMNTLIFLVPISAMALTASSLPVHLQFLRLTSASSDRVKVERSYVSGLLAVCVTALSLLSLALFLFWPGISSVLLLSICAVFLIEKFSDELTRYFEFRRLYSRWFVVQLIRSAWLVIPIGLALIGYDYQTAILSLACGIALISITAFFLFTGLKPAMDSGGLALVKSNLAYLSSAGLVAMHRQLPRITVAALFPQFAHIFQAIAQLTQGISLLFNVKYQIPYRSIIARKTASFERVLYPVFRKLLLLVIVLLIFSLSVAVLVPSVLNWQAGLVAVLAVAMIADSLGFSIATTYLGYLPWYLKPRVAFTTFCLALAALFFCFLSGYLILTASDSALIVVPATTIVVSLLWIALIRYRHFRRIKL